MKRRMRGVFFTCNDMQGNDQTAVTNAGLVAKGMTRSYEAQLLQREIPEAEKALGRKITDAEIETLMKNMGVVVRVIKAEIDI